MHAGLHSSQQLQSHHTPRRNPPPESTSSNRALIRISSTSSCSIAQRIKFRSPAIPTEFGPPPLTCRPLKIACRSPNSKSATNSMDCPLLTSTAAQFRPDLVQVPKGAMPLLSPNVARTASRRVPAQRRDYTRIAYSRQSSGPSAAISSTHSRRFSPLFACSTASPASIRRTTPSICADSVAAPSR